MSKLILSIIPDLFLAKKFSDYDLVLVNLERSVQQLNLQRWYSNEREFLETSYVEMHTPQLFLYRFMGQCLMLIVPEAKESGCNNTYLLSYIIRNVPLKLLASEDGNTHYAIMIKDIEADLKNNGMGKWYEAQSAQIAFDFSLGKY